MKTPPILLKLLYNSAAQASTKFNKTASRKGDGGFTLLEVLATVLVLGILSSIAAPSWLAFINRQRVRTVNDRVLQTLRTAQSEAKRTKSDVVVTFNTSDDPPTATIDTLANTQVTPPPNPPIQKVTFDAGGEVKAGQIQKPLSVGNKCDKGVCTNDTNRKLIFSYNGTVDPNNLNNPKLPFVVIVASVDGGKQCVILETLLGGMRTAEGKYDSTTTDGCPVVQ